MFQSPSLRGRRLNGDYPYVVGSALNVGFNPLHRGASGLTTPVHQ